MIARKKSPNRRRAGARREQNLLEVKIRSRLAHRQRNRRLLVGACKVFLLFALVGGLFWSGREGLRHFFWENPEYNLAVVQIRNDGPAITREMVLEATGLRLGENIFSVNLAQARAALAELPQVEQVELRRALPNKIAIELTERRPVAWLADTGVPDPAAAESSFLIDAKGIFFKPKRQLPEYLRLPVIYGAQPENFLPGDLAQAPELCAALELIRLNADTGRMLIRSIDLSKRYCMVVTNSTGEKILFPLDEIARHLDRLVAVLEGVPPGSGEIQSVNLLVERNIPVTFVPPPAEPVMEAPAPIKEQTPKAGSGKRSKGSKARHGAAVSSTARALR